MISWGMDLRIGSSRTFKCRLMKELINLDVFRYTSNPNLELYKSSFLDKSLVAHNYFENKLREIYSKKN